MASSLAGLQKVNDPESWKDLSDADKIERMRGIIKHQQQEISALAQQLKAIEHNLIGHKHIGDGRAARVLGDDSLALPLETKWAADNIYSLRIPETAPYDLPDGAITDDYYF